MTPANVYAIVWVAMVRSVESASEHRIEEHPHRPDF